MKSQMSVKGGPDGADFLHTDKIGHFTKKKKTQNSVVVWGPLHGEKRCLSLK